MECITKFPLKVYLWLQPVGVLVCFLITTFCVLLVGRTALGLILGELIICFISYANCFVLMSRKSPILPWDLASIGTAISVAKEYTFEFTTQIIIISVLWGLLILLTIPARIKLERSFRSRFAGMLCTLLLTACVCIALMQESIDELLDVYEMPFTQDVTYGYNGFFVSFFVNMKYLIVKKPDGYSVKAAEKILTESEAEAGDAPEELPNIIVIMNEAFSDLSVINEFKTSEEYLPYFNSLKGSENTISGDVYVSVLGGNTANTEFEFLTGNTMAFLPTGSIPYQQYITDAIPAMPQLLKTYNYDTVALHPYNARGWRRNQIYPLFGFDDMLFSIDFKYKERMRTYITDKSSFEQVIYEYETRDEASDNPFFSFLVTMQNHGGYAKEWDGFTRSLTVEESSVKKLNRINAYLTCIKETDKAFEELISYYKDCDEKTIILMFGDHQPNVETAFLEELYGKPYDELTEEEMALRYQTPFLLWANYDIEEQADVQISANYLGALLLETAGIPKTAYGNFLDQVQEELPILTANFAYDKDGNFYSQKEFSSLSKTASELLSDYKIVQYYNLFAKKKRNTSYYLP